MSPTIDYTETLVVTHCWCGISLAVPSNLEAHARERDGFAIYCPIGHTFVYRDSYEKKLKAERQRHEATRELLAAEERSHTATRGHLTRQKKRVAAGVCPCCHRHFENLERHMGSKHPDFAGTPA
jgi:hypothetical protein